MNARQVTVYPSIPEPIKALSKIAYNIWFGWNQDALELFETLDPDLWKKVGSNPVMMLNRLKKEKLEYRSTNKDFVAALDSVENQLESYLTGDKWFHTQSDNRSDYIAYFSTEFCLHESIPQYAGGLGVLAGDHIKSASDLGLPLVAVGLFYHQGYFTQKIDQDCRQQEELNRLDRFHLPLRVVTKNGSPLVMHLALGSEQLWFQVLEMKVGTISLYLLDADIEKNPEHLRGITRALYDHDRDLRLKQEILLGVGGARALCALNKTPKICHINEGHSAFLILERIRLYRQNEQLSFNEACQLVQSTNIFTTHTPVPAGNERFDHDLIERYLKEYVEHVGFFWEEFLRLGREPRNSQEHSFSMTAFALNLSERSNGVSKIHSKVAKYMWKDLWPKIQYPNTPIGHVTNGVHGMTWVNPGLKSLFEKLAKKKGKNEINWGDTPNISDEEIWENHLECKRRLAEKIAEISGHPCIDWGSKVFVIGFARRFSEYKRGSLILKDIKRIKELISKSNRSIVFIFSGKAHPDDEIGKEIIKEIVTISKSQDLGSQVIFVEDYNVALAKLLVQGVDLWLNNPVRLMEASGTSGMKAAMNGVLNLSVLDGWWDEAHTSDLGWWIPYRENYNSPQDRDEEEFKALSEVLFREIIPLFYNRDSFGLPRRWIDMMKCSIETVGQDFDSNRMVIDYWNLGYAPCLELQENFIKNDYKGLRGLLKWEQHNMVHWDKIQIVSFHADNQSMTGEEQDIAVSLDLFEFPEDSLSVDVYTESTDPEKSGAEGSYHPLNIIKSRGEYIEYKGKVKFETPGHYNHYVCITPNHPMMSDQKSYQFKRWL